ncbi:hypothetical protein D3C71_501080 [compost metagenome]|uniref:STAS-like domain-containing protein n=1 Tax=Achromobacter sp. Root83 TaxID=1736602 RepID=UPI000AA17E68|nr:DUF4325 domain-containing protein [Achromobacter sp. Root83]
MGKLQALAFDPGGQQAEPGRIQSNVAPISAIRSLRGRSGLVIPVRNVRVSLSETFVTRYQARRVLNTVPPGTLRVCFDFSGIGSIGPAFADEIFFIYARQNASTEIAWEGAEMHVKNHILWAVSRAKQYQPAPV